MKQRLFSILLIAFLCSMPALAQLSYFSVAEFAYAPSDNTASAQQYQETDDNGALYAIIKVKSDQPDDNLQSFRFDFGLMNSFVVPRPKEKELWVYVQKNAKTVTISRDGYVSVSKYDLGQSIRAGYTYKMKLSVSRSTESSQPQPTTGALSIVSSPVGANIKIDGKDYGQTPNNILNLTPGRHTLILSLDKYKQYTRPFEIQESKTTEMNVELEEVYADKQKEFSFTVNGNGRVVTFKMKPVEADTTIMAGGEFFVNYPVTLHDYLMGETEVTQALWYAVMGQSPITPNESSNDYSWKSEIGIGDNLPAYNISYVDIQKFLSALNKLTGQQFRVPTNAEWEFAARGGKKSRGYQYAGSNKMGNMWFHENSESRLHEVKGKQPNELGLYDMSGNVSETVIDVKDNKIHDAYGGNYLSHQNQCHFNSQTSTDKDIRRDNIGFRLAMNPIDRPPVKFSIASTPSGANIKIDGKDYGKTPKTIPNLTSGTHLVELSANGYFTESKEIEIFKDDKINMELDHTCPDSKHPHQIDMGNGVKWACCNEGAHKPSDNGDYYIWDNIEAKGPWRIPTSEEQEELVKNCVWTWTRVDGVEGYKVKAPNGNCIFLPVPKEGLKGYWSSSYDKEYTDKFHAKGLIRASILWTDYGTHSVSTSLMEVVYKAVIRPVANQ